MLKLDLKSMASKYTKDVVSKMTNVDFETNAQMEKHTKCLADCQRGSTEAKEYVLDCINKILADKITDNDRKEIFECIKVEVNTYNKKLYETFNIEKFSDQDERLISYYQLLAYSLSEKQKEKLKNIENRIKQDSIELAIEILSEEIYKSEYGLNILENIFELQVNNIEVHNTKIRVEDKFGRWFTLSDYEIPDTETTRLIAKRLLNQNAGGDLTEDECERQSMLENGSRITVALRPASTMDTIFIKKFDNAVVNEKEMLSNGTLTEGLVNDLKILAKGRANIIFSGGVNAGKSTMLKTYVGFIPTKYKIGMLDPTRDTNLKEVYPEKDIITLYQTEQYDLNTQFSFMLTMNRDIMGISEAKSYEILQAIKGMTRGNSGSFLTLHSLMAKDIVDNIAWMCLENGIPQDISILRYRVANAIDIVLRLRQLENGRRVVDEMSEIVATGSIQEPFKVNNIWYYDVETEEIVKNKEYKPSKDLINKLRYYGCSEEEIRRFANNE